MIGNIRKTSQATPQEGDIKPKLTDLEPEVKKKKEIEQAETQSQLERIARKDFQIKEQGQKKEKFPSNSQNQEAKTELKENQNKIQEVKKEEDALQEEKKEAIPTYFTKQGKQYVKPYQYEFKSYAKKRWLKQSILSIFEAQFKLYDKAYYEAAINSGKITVNGKIVSPSYLIKNNDCIEHRVMRQEKPVLAREIEIVEENEDFVIVNKPPSMAIHPCGGFRYNSLIEILSQKYKKKNLHCVHRLDLQTSGILFLAKNADAATHFTNAIKAGNVSKMYLALVYGEVKEEEFEVDKAMGRMKGPVAKFSVNQDECKEDWKEAFTRFKVIKRNQDSTLLECYPKTGRTHQIRVHLTSVGHPIVGDELYASKEQIQSESTKVCELGFQFCLHSLEYIYEKKTYSTSRPEWAKN